MLRVGFQPILASVLLALASSNSVAQAPTTGQSDLEHARIELEREKWRSELQLRTRELDLKEHEQKTKDGELAVKEHEQLTKDGELKLKERELATSQWTNPLFVAILAALLAALGNAVVVGVNGRLQRQLDTAKGEAERTLEKNQAESTRILEMIKTPDTEAAAQNLSFLLDSGLIASPELVNKLRTYLEARQPGTGPSLPATSRFDFEPTEVLTASLQQDLELNLTRYIEYLNKIGLLSGHEEKAKVKIDNLSPPNAFYDSGSGTLVIDSRIANDPYVAMREYGHHVLLSDWQGVFWSQETGVVGLESGLADYFAGSFLENPILGQAAIKVIVPGRPYVRRLDNERTFVEALPQDRSPMHELAKFGAVRFGKCDKSSRRMPSIHYWPKLGVHPAPWRRFWNPSWQWREQSALRNKQRYFAKPWIVAHFLCQRREIRPRWAEARAR
jgi:hypothetical protein